MDLEAAAGYLVALAVPLWLVGEYAVHSWKSMLKRRPHHAAKQISVRRASGVSHAPAPRLAGHQRSA